MGNLKKYIIGGLLVWLPFAATVIIIKIIINLIDNIIHLLPPSWRPEILLGFSIPGFGIVLAIPVLLLTGMFVANFVGQRLVVFWEASLNRIPLISSIYNGAKQISGTILDPSNKSFRKVVRLQYPRKGLWSIGFLTGGPANNETVGLNDYLVSVFIPTTPNPTSGFIILVPPEDITELDISIQEGFKFIISIGVITPDVLLIKPLLTTNKVAQTTDDS
jgi:uncharacterized membrane protein